MTKWQRKDGLRQINPDRDVENTHTHTERRLIFITNQMLNIFNVFIYISSIYIDRWDYQ